MAGLERQLTLRFLAEPADVNFGGKVHGGAVMKWIDLAGYACAAGWSGKYCITAYAGGIRFVKPIHVGNIVEVTAKVIYTGRTSMHLGVDVKAGDPKHQDRHLTTHCVLVMVAVDDEGQPTAVPDWKPELPADIELRESAIRLMEMRKKIGAEMQAHVDLQPSLQVP
ncbi:MULTISPECIES: acyl-CoA thioesterase [Shewanella]|uniref:Acyl-CoA thioesterase n=1 Tax=Shewanella fidelis TaxID=173509 RepID=A0AAW8NMP2_9GAMM|nr:MULTISPECIES: acyl-CoA thioesterase [Shewanella]MDR8524152.1 acyl-CoA thioesterase [Shewanella fidelis]MDW4810699.1 acyl-CoA thioesterase [Shewanella fidelis]MDW4814820.1 acyl-CoA thioesterase [Shewanella fidelis]MDW4818910.1 acyl-CoA thioesterase [Shewanella fidelis]MDW4823413.1 acyl-CoA thioesterase [Shewanella fidelis]